MSAATGRAHVKIDAFVPPDTAHLSIVRFTVIVNVESAAPEAQLIPLLDGTL